MATYLDTSALTKLVIGEAESSALVGWLAEEDRGATTCDLARTELLRAVRRVAPVQDLRAWLILERVTLTEMTKPVLRQAGLLDPPVLRSLDAIHLAAALDLGDDLEAMVTYDERLAEAAVANGIRVVAPA